MNSILTVDKLILCYYLNTDSNIKLNKNYIQRNYQCTELYYDLGNGFLAYENKSQDEKEIKNSYSLGIEYKKRKIGTLFFENQNKNCFFFKYHKKIFYDGEHTILQIKHLIDNLFPFSYQYQHITRLEIALDTVGNLGMDLTVITDLCSNNLYFSSIKKYKNEFEAIFEKFGGRKFTDARYGSKIGNLKIYHHSKYLNTTCIGHYSSPIFIKCYDKSQKSEPYQTTYFNKFFKPHSQIYRLEASIDSRAADKFTFEIGQLDNIEYLIRKYKEIVGNRLTFNDLNRPYRDKYKNKKYHTINLLANVDFPIRAELQDYRFNLDSEEKVKRFKTKNKDSIVNANRSIVAKAIGQFLRDKDQDNSYRIIKDVIKTKILTYDDRIPDIKRNIKVVKNLVLNQLFKNDFIMGIERAELFLKILEKLEEESIKPKKLILSKNTLTVSEFYRIDPITGKKNGIHLKIVKKS